MKMDKGKLKQIKNGFRVMLPTKKGSADFAIPEKAVCFRKDDGEDGLEVDVERDAQNRIVKVTIPGKEVVTPRAAAPPADKRRGASGGRGGSGRGRGQQDRRGGRGQQRGRSQPAATRGVKKAPPQAIGLPFHNPYTFLPFGEQREAHAPTPLTVDEVERQRVTGVLELEVTTQSPLLSCHPNPIKEEQGHKTYAALTIGNDVIVPATGIRGALRTLLTVLTGGTLGYMNEHAYLCQGRDVQLGPRGDNGSPTKPAKVFLAEVTKPGSTFRDGEIRLGETKLVRLTALERVNKRRLPRGDRGPTLWAGFDDQGSLTTIKTKSTAQTPWKLKISGQPVGGRKALEKKREGAFLPNGPPIVLPSEFWEAYSGRNAHGSRPELRKGDLIWLEPKDPNATEITEATQIESIQWARWGKRGQPLKDENVVPKHVWPDVMQDGDTVDTVTNLFGQVPGRGQQATSFAARIRPENLAFADARSKVFQEHLAPLAPPHPGCMAFYRQSEAPDDVSEKDSLRGYKIYRTSQERGDQAPWKFNTQGVYDDFGKLKSPKQKVNKTCELLPEGSVGTLRIAFRALSAAELALLIQATAVPWRLGGGKPLSLGLCHVRLTRILGEDGEDLRFEGPEFAEWTSTSEGGVFAVNGWQKQVGHLSARVAMWCQSQLPVKRLRYPRAVTRNNHKNARGGHSWFQRHAMPRMVSTGDDGQREPGIAPLHVDGELKRLVTELAGEGIEPMDPTLPMIAGQLLPLFQPNAPDQDLLYGYDGIVTDLYQSDNRRTFVKRIEEFDTGKHVTGKEQSSVSSQADQKGENPEDNKLDKGDRREGAPSGNRESRREQRRGRQG